MITETQSTHAPTSFRITVNWESSRYFEFTSERNSFPGRMLIKITALRATRIFNASCVPLAADSLSNQFGKRKPSVYVEASSRSLHHQHPEWGRRGGNHGEDGLEKERGGEIGMEWDGQLAEEGKRGGWISRGKERSSRTSPRERVEESVGHGTTNRGTYSRLSTSKLPLTAPRHRCVRPRVRVCTSKGSYPFRTILHSMPAILRS